MVNCDNKEMVKLREQLKSNLIKVNYQYTQFSIRNIINILLHANDISTNYYFAIFLKKVFTLVKSTYTRRTNVQPWSESNGEINLIIIGWIILWVVVDLFDNIHAFV